MKEGQVGGEFEAVECVFEVHGAAVMMEESKTMVCPKMEKQSPCLQRPGF
jgi:hypothetical protein